MNYEKICEWISAQPVNLDSLDDFSKREFHFLENLPSQNPESVCFFFSQAYKNELIQSAPGILVTGSAFVEPLKNVGLPLWNKTLILEVKDPYFALAKLSEFFAKTQSFHSHLKKEPETKIHPSSTIHPSAKIADGVSVGAFCIIEQGVVLEKDVILYPHVYIGPHTVVGEGSVLFPKVTLYENTVIGKNVRIHAGCVIGADGFGYAPQVENGKPVAYAKIYHLGNVIIEDEVEVGANSCIDRGTMGSTVIGFRTKIDNHVQIGHNVKTGESCIICGNVGLAGSVTLGKFVTIAGMTGVNNKVKMGDYSMVGPFSAISKDISSGSRVRGYPQREDREHLQMHSMLNRMLEQYKKDKQKNKNQSSQEKGL